MVIAHLVHGFQQLAILYGHDEYQSQLIQEQHQHIFRSSHGSDSNFFNRSTQASFIDGFLPMFPLFIHFLRFFLYPILPPDEDNYNEPPGAETNPNPNIVTQPLQPPFRSMLFPHLNTVSEINNLARDTQDDLASTLLANTLLRQAFAQIQDNPFENRGVSSEEARGIGEAVIFESSNENEEPEVCVICQEQFKDGDECTRMPCTHLFHRECNQRWMETNALCAVCRFDPREQQQQQRQQRQINT